MALPTLLEAPSMRAIWAFSFIETASPALSSAGEVIREPEDNRASDWLNMEEECMSRVALLCADRFVLMTITLIRESPPLRGIDFARRPCRGCVLSRATHRIPVGFFWLPTANRFLSRHTIHRSKSQEL